MQNPWVCRIATALAIVALPLGMLSVWIGAYVGDTDRYVRTVAPLAADPEVKKATVDFLERETMAVLLSGDEFGDTLRTLDLSCIGVDAAFLGGVADLANAFLTGTALGNVIREQIEPQVRLTVHEAITQAVESDTFAQAWVAANRQAHREVLAALEDVAAPDSPAEEVLLPLAEVSAMISGFIACPNLITPETLAQIRSSLALVDADELRGAHTGYQVLKALRWVLPVLFVLGLLVAVLSSGSRRRTGWQLALGFLLGMGVLQLGLIGIKATITAQGVDQDIFDAIWGSLTRALTVSMVVIAVTSAVVAGVLWFRASPSPSNHEDRAR